MKALTIAMIITAGPIAWANPGAPNASSATSFVGAYDVSQNSRAAHVKAITPLLVQLNHAAQRHARDQQGLARRVFEQMSLGHRLKRSTDLRKLTIERAGHKLTITSEPLRRRPMLWRRWMSTKNRAQRHTGTIVAERTVDGGQLIKVQFYDREYQQQQQQALSFKDAALALRTAIGECEIFFGKEGALEMRSYSVLTIGAMQAKTRLGELIVALGGDRRWRDNIAFEQSVFKGRRSRTR